MAFEMTALEEERNRGFSENSHLDSRFVPQEKWKICIVDDEEEVHSVTRFALGGYTYLGRGLEYVSAYSGEGAKELLRQHDDIAVILLDVVMEEEDAGFKLVEHIRNEMGNKLVRIILRTGQPGVAPEEEAIFKYDINDYKDKTELTDKKLFAAITTALRSYSDIMTIEYLRQNLEKKVQERTWELQELNHHLEERVVEEVKKVHRQEQLLVAQSKMAAMGELLGVIAHQWKQPLTVLSLVSDTLKQSFELGKGSDEEVVKATENIIAQVKFMSVTIDDFRNFLKPSKQPQLFDVYEALHHVLSLLSSLIESHGVDVEVERIGFKEGESIDVCGYVSEFKQVLLNVISNAMDAIINQMKENSLLHGRITIRFVSRGDDVVLEIEDNGGGIPLNVIEKIFDSYYTTKGEKGTGIGLYMSKTIIENNMNGHLFVRNGSDGAVFFIELKREKIGDF